MGNKISPVIIFVIILVIIAMGILAFSMINSNDSTSGENSAQGNSENPILELSLNTMEENQEKVVINVLAKMEDGSLISTIVLPDGTEILSTETTYEVTQNGDYTFKAISENGEETSNTITVSNIKEASAFNPYIPVGFSAVEGSDVENGFVIEDAYGNQYVWIPIENGKLTRDTEFDSNYEEIDNTASDLVNSVAKNYGFYVARYEASEYEINGEKAAATMGGKTPWTNLTYLEAAEYAKDSAVKFEYEDVNTAIINSYVWDTVLKLFDEKVQNYSTNINYGNYSGTLYPTGATQSDIIYNICDIAGNVREWTTEVYKDEAITTNGNEEILYRVVRGGSASLSRTPKSHTGYAENTMEAYWGFRMILYK